jgi:hypothetical protein
MLLNETLLSFSEAAERLPAINGRKPTPQTVWRWAVLGLRGIHLESRRIGGRFATSLEALDRFTKALAEASHREPPPRSTKSDEPKKRSTIQRERAIARARKNLRRSGCEV